MFWVKIFAALAVLLAGASPVFAIPSPELVIGSVSSLAQVLGVGVALISVGLATIAARFGIKWTPGKTSRAGNVITLILLAGCIALSALLFQQNQSTKAKDLQRLQATLVRPAQFAGTKIQDETLKETSFQAQTSSVQSISTSQAEQLLKQDDGTTFIDVREFAENQMGTLPNSKHIRFPDIQQSVADFKGKSVVLFCHNGNRSSETCENLAAMGIDCRYIAGGLEKWIVEGREFSDETVRGLSDLRAIPEYKNKDKLLSTDDFTALSANQDIQIVDTRYPGDFNTGHLPNAINIPLRAMPTDALNAQLDTLENKPTVAACYDRRSCFIGQVLGYEMSKRGIDFLGRYTTPWDYFVPPKPKDHVQEWIAEQNVTLWDRAVGKVSNAIVWVADQSHILIAIALLSLLSRLMVLPISIKSERDQIASKGASEALISIKKKLADDPIRKARALKRHQADLGLTPIRNLLALLFLPLMALGLTSVEQASKQLSYGMLWLDTFAAMDPYYILPVGFALLAEIYLHVAVSNTYRQKVFCWFVATPLLFGLTFRLSAAGNVYLCISLILLLIQRAYVVGAIGRGAKQVQGYWQVSSVKFKNQGIVPLAFADGLADAGNKSYRLAILKHNGFPVPDGVVLPFNCLDRFKTLNDKQKKSFTDKIWDLIGRKTCVVRSSAAEEDGEGKSFAGVFESVLYVDKGNLREALQEVLDSFSSTRAANYDQSEDKEFKGNILIQQMVQAEYSGVLFTQDPQAAGAIMLEIAKGTADDLVSGRVTPQTLRYGRYSKSNLGSEEAPIALEPLLEICMDIETLFKTPQDIEWVYQNGTFSIVQSRDITTLGLGSDAHQAKFQEWNRLFNRFQGCKLGEVLLEQDEMSEVLPRPTPLTFSIMADVWRAGGSVEMACRKLSVAYDMPEKLPGHLVQVFSKVYSDSQLKAQTALKLSSAKAKLLTKKASELPVEYHEEILPKYQRKIARWEAIDPAKLGSSELVGCIREVHSDFVNQTYVDVETINIMASFVSKQARLDGAANVVSGDLKYSATRLLATGNDLAPNERRASLLKMMGHRAVFDYELSVPRYSETPDILWDLAMTNDDIQGHFLKQDKSKTTAEDMLVVKYQNLKELAKHEAVRTFAVQRKFILELARQTNVDDLIFYLSIDEIEAFDQRFDEGVLEKAKLRREKIELFKNNAPKRAKLSLMDMEAASLPQVSTTTSNDGALVGTRVSGEEPVTAKVYVASDVESESGADLPDFTDGDILICKMLHPRWLPYVVRSGGVVSEVGGWLSHMAIVAREKGVAMVVGCDGWDQLKTGETVTIDSNGVVEVLSDYKENITHIGQVSGRL